jgi:hypothetical protein
MTFFTEKQVEEYKAGWYEEHPDDELDDAEVESILEEEERERMIQLLVKDDLETDAEIGEKQYFELILRDGFTGYDHESDINLRDEIEVRDLKDKVWGDWYEY